MSDKPALGVTVTGLTSEGLRRKVGVTLGTTRSNRYKF